MNDSPLEIQIIILNYRGADLLPQCLPSIVEAAKKASHKTFVTLLNNPGGGNDGIDYVKSSFPDVLVVEAPENRILCSYNEYLPDVQEDIVILLNNDIRVDVNFVDPLVAHFAENQGMFLVAPRVMSFDGEELQAGPTRAGLKFGLFWCDARYEGVEKDADEVSSTFSSGFGAFSRSKFLELGGYDDRYLPGIMEDVDLCYRAQKKGYVNVYEPKSVVYHIGQASFKEAFGSYKTAVMAHRNNFLFMWKNYSGFGFWVPHLFFLPLRLLWAACRGNWGLVVGFFKALRPIPWEVPS